MPLKQCTKDGKSGFSWGHGTCFTGPNGKKKAIKVGLAIEGPDKFKKIMESEGIIKEDLLDIMSNPETSDEDFTTLANILGLNMNEQIGLNVKRIKRSE